MSIEPGLQQRLERLVGSHRVVLFMKGTRSSPRCGFSAATVGALDAVSPDYLDVDVLQDPEVREGIKVFGNWPTIPQLYVDGELVGGADIVLGMARNGELHALLGVAPPDRTPPVINITQAAADAIRRGLEDAGDDRLHLQIDAAYRAQFLLQPARGDEIVASAAGLELLMDPASAQRARGIVIDWVETVQGAGLSIHNPNAPPPVQPLAVGELSRELATGSVTVIDIRPAAERERAPFSRAEILDTDSMARLSALPKETRLAFLCHHGNSSRAAAEHFRGLGFRNVCNIEGGIEAWSREIDATVPRY
jgi:monothiol glutaredoxin